MLVKLIITAVSTVILLVHMQPVSRMAATASRETLTSADHRRVRIQLIADAAAAMLALLVATGFSVYKPRGMTSYGRRRQRQERALAQS